MGNLSTSILKSPTGSSRRARNRKSSTNKKDVHRLATSLAGEPRKIQSINREVTK
jgi:hypothetical protein